MELAIDLRTEDVRDDIVRAAAHQLLSRAAFDEDGQEVSLASDLAQRLTRHVDDALKQVTAEVARPIVEAALKSDLPTYDRYGYKATGTKTLAEKIGDEVLAAVTKKQHGSSSRNLLDGLVHEHVQTKLRGDLKDTIEAAKGEALQAVRDEAVKAIEDALRRAGGHI